MKKVQYTPGISFFWNGLQAPRTAHHSTSSRDCLDVANVTCTAPRVAVFLARAFEQAGAEWTAFADNILVDRARIRHWQGRSKFQPHQATCTGGPANDASQPLFSSSSPSTTSDGHAGRARGAAKLTQCHQPKPKRGNTAFILFFLVCLAFPNDEAARRAAIFDAITLDRSHLTSHPT